MNEPKISVIISTFNRASYLDETLNSLVEQTLPKDQYEVIVIDDGSTDHTRQVAANFESKLSVHYLFQENSGLAAGRNRGVQLAKGPIVHFMDDDDIADPRLLEEHVGTHLKYPDENITVLGFTDLREDIASLPLMHFVTEVGNYLFCYSKLQHGQILDYKYFWGGRTSCKKEFLIKHELFDPIFKFGCEDIELGYRLFKYGLKVVYNKNARSTMIRSFSLEQFCERSERQGYSNWRFREKHPTPEIIAWTETADLDTRWENVEKSLSHYKKSASDLEKIVLRV